MTTGSVRGASPQSLARFLRRVAGTLGGVAVDGYSVEDATSVLAACEHHRRALAALEARLTTIVSNGSESLGRDRLRTGLGISTAEAARRARVAGVVGAEPEIGEAMAAGTVSEAHADGLAAARRIAGAQLSPHIPELLDLAARSGADEFGVAARDWARRVSEDGGEAHAERLRRRRFLRWWKTPDGMTRMSADLDPESAETICASITARLRSRWSASNPSGHADLNSRGDGVDARRVDALVDLCSQRASTRGVTDPIDAEGVEAAGRLRPPDEVSGVIDSSDIDADGMEAAGGSRPPDEVSGVIDSSGIDADADEVVAASGSRPPDEVPGRKGRSSPGTVALPLLGVLIDIQTLADGLHPGSICELSSGEPLAVSVARRMACDADIFPAVLGGASVVLDLGRSHRLVNRSQRRALGIRDRGCTETTCTAPPEWCDAHHVIDWYGPRRGPTDLDNLVLLCRYHHSLLHRELWSLPPEVIARAERCLERHRRRRGSRRARGASSGRQAEPP